MTYSRDAALATQHALTEDEQAALVARVPEPQRVLFAAWLRGERTLDGDLVTEGVDAHV